MQSVFPSIPKSAEATAGSEPLDWDSVFKSKWPIKWDETQQLFVIVFSGGSRVWDSAGPVKSRSWFQSGSGSSWRCWSSTHFFGGFRDFSSDSLNSNQFLLKSASSFKSVKETWYFNPINVWTLNRVFKTDHDKNSRNYFREKFWTIHLKCLK